MNLDYLKETYHLTKTESQILYYLDQQSTNAADLSIREVAKHCFSSPSSIIRLAKKLNLSGYNELIYKLKRAHFLSQSLLKQHLHLKQPTSFVDCLPNTRVIYLLF